MLANLESVLYASRTQGQGQKNAQWPKNEVALQHWKLGAIHTKSFFDVHGEQVDVAFSGLLYGAIPSFFLHEEHRAHN